MSEKHDPKLAEHLKKCFNCSLGKFIEDWKTAHPPENGKFDPRIYSGLLYEVVHEFQTIQREDERTKMVDDSVHEMITVGSIISVVKDIFDSVRADAARELVGSFLEKIRRSGKLDG